MDINYDLDHWDCEDLTRTQKLEEADCTGDNCSKPDLDTSIAELSAGAKVAKQSCHDAVSPEKCYVSVTWAMSDGIWQHPEWYEGVTGMSTFKEFQAKLNSMGQGDCPRPCEDSESEGSSSDEDTALTTTREETTIEENRTTGKHSSEVTHKLHKTEKHVDGKHTEKMGEHCSWAGDDCSESRCCAERACTWDFQTCKPMTCFKKNTSFAECLEECPKGWDCKKLGQSASPDPLPAAKKGAKRHGTSLFCFAVAMSGEGSESQDKTLMDYQQKEGLGIFACDAHSVLTVKQQHEARGYKSKSNINFFVEHWDKVRKDDVWAKYDWTVKVDPDTVFFPNRLKLRLDKLNTPAGASVYIENIDFKYKFISALEVLSKAALKLYFSHRSECQEHLGSAGSEDYFIKACLDAVGARHQSDFSLLRDRYAEPSMADCTDGDAAAFHYFKEVKFWEACHQEASKASGAIQTGL
jgi:hypothetical protein